VTRILVGAADGLHVLEDAWEVGVEHPGRRVTALARDGGELWAILDRKEVRRTEAGRWSPWSVTLLNASLTCVAATRAGVLAGQSEAHLDRIVETGLEIVQGFESVAGRDEWYTPWGGPPDTRSIAEDDDAVYVNVHVGGIPRSRDGGETWEPTIDVDADVHRVCAGSGVGVFAACARGLAISSDGGDTWTIEAEGLHASYCRGVAVCGETVLVSASTGPRGGRAAVYRGRFEGGPFERCSTGLPEWFDGNVDSAWLDATSELAAFGTEDGRVFASSDEGRSWDEVVSGLVSIGCVAVVP
jgi:hypothetical protein